MKKKKSLIVLILALTLLISVLPVTVSANAPGPNPDGSYDTNPVMVVLIVVVSLLGIGFTCLVEWMIAKPFKLLEFGKQIIVTNLATQIIMRALQYWVVPVILPEEMWAVWYVVSIIVLEILVFVSEFAVYCKIMAWESRKDICIYTLVANIASAVGGVLLLLLIM